MCGRRFFVPECPRVTIHVVYITIHCRYRDPFALQLSWLDGLYQQPRFALSSDQKFFVRRIRLERRRQTSWTRPDDFRRCNNLLSPRHFGSSGPSRNRHRACPLRTSKREIPACSTDGAHHGRRAPAACFLPVLGADRGIRLQRRTGARLC